MKKIKIILDNDANIIYHLSAKLMVKSQVRHKDGREFSTGVADKKRKIWVPPGIGTPAGAYDLSKKNS